MSIKGVDPAIFERPDMQRALAERDIGAVYRLLVTHGVSQAYIAQLVDQKQSEVSEIISGRKVQGYDVLVRVADGLGVSRGAMGLSYGGEREGDDPLLFDEVTEDMRRRALLAVGSLALFNRPVLGQLLELPERPSSPTPLPSELGYADVEAIVELTRSLEAEAQHYGGGAMVLSPVAQRAERLLEIPGAELTTLAMSSAVAELHNVAGWASFDSHLDDTARYHFARAMSLGNGGDGIQFVRAAYLAGVATAERGHYNDGIKLMQLAQMRLGEAPGDPRASELAAWINADMACALAHMDATDPATSALRRAQGGWQAPHVDDEADMQWVIAVAEMNMGRFDVAERLASSAVRHWTGTSNRRQAVLGRITLATLNVNAAEQQGNAMAHQVITEIRELRSIRARERLAPLVAALSARHDNESVQLAGLARRVMTVL